MIHGDASIPSDRLSAAQGTRRRPLANNYGLAEDVAPADRHPVAGHTQDPFFANGSRGCPGARRHIDATRQTGAKYISKAWIHTCWIVEIIACGTRDGKSFMPFTCLGQTCVQSRRLAETGAGPPEHRELDLDPGNPAR